MRISISLSRCGQPPETTDPQPLPSTHERGDPSNDRRHLQVRMRPHAVAMWNQYIPLRAGVGLRFRDVIVKVCKTEEGKKMPAGGWIGKQKEEFTQLAPTRARTEGLSRQCIRPDPCSSVEGSKGGNSLRATSSKNNGSKEHEGVMVNADRRGERAALGREAAQHQAVRSIVAKGSGERRANLVARGERLRTADFVATPDGCGILWQVAASAGYSREEA
ncbi:hypothetical protein BDK51DRAFT_50351 [Blyttiomyces helicus]|uniref:Uncharacterized protein n=1 Tax=Blyttiomyces helicus TaxID=388810 RepID=A0A4P9VXM6_9FUNG|nr:hypothetical protein BDK51DRAFT_50351 [Blyttiomyces helicus]|eukprot:RKO83038.1 hypothetical protein BDK51DRAFT_50351 [Blyttiomyces helicus]